MSLMLGHQKLFTVLRFLALKEEQGARRTPKAWLSSNLRWYQWYYPTVTAIIGTGLVWCLDLNFIFEGDKNLLVRVNSLLAMLVGFYIAALAAVATFQSPRLEEEIVGRRIFAGGVSLRRRQFLCAVFGYCTGMSIAVFGIGSIYELVAFELQFSTFLTSNLDCLALLGIFIYFWLCSSLMYVTLLGLNYLVDRMHR
ncbi:hypothetical protein [Aliiroseovarius sp. PrR006]|uniref:hypothetical protein n=1 Tax=Aliiroseovarius sp. PrR006 TaxID=2706883 RepID=UPI0013D1C539|nr:hypothetical protein [Aliiroseovarius sp. PrR006]NDW53652.1 hypothetical protein [Aliiroseovarius sp. PrR006]